MAVSASDVLSAVGVVSEILQVIAMASTTQLLVSQPEVLRM
jgi:hypothetical protein